MSEGDAPKLIIDDDWKSQAKAEKERLAKEAEAKAASKPAGPGGAPGAAGGMPEEVGFVDLIRLLATQALMYLGAFPDPQTGKAVVALDVAKLNIDLLGVLAEKTEGNLSEEESSAMTGTLNELRMQYVEVARAVTKAVDEGRIGPGGEIQPGAGGAPAGGNPLGAPPPGV
ncbi:MAG: DUF1844 domain-containing protein [Planctomycetota bacterium]